MCICVHICNFYPLYPLSSPPILENPFFFPSLLLLLCLLFLFCYPLRYVRGHLHQLKCGQFASGYATEENGSPLPSNCPLPAALQGGVCRHDIKHSPMYNEMFMGFILWESHVDEHTCYVLMCTMAMLWPEVIVSQHPSPFFSPYIQSISSSLMSLCLGESEIDVPLWAVSLSVLTCYVSLHSLL